MRFFLAVCALNLVQDFVTLVDSWSNLLLASEARRVLEVADDAPILQMQLGREIELDGHMVETSGCAGRSGKRLIPNKLRISPPLRAKHTRLSLTNRRTQHGRQPRA
jgi:hypothetical protein